MTTHCLSNHLPIKLLQGDSVGWLNAGHIGYREPFFDETISKIRCLVQNRHPYKSASSLQMLNEWGTALDSVKPSAIIFHVSRCGSTLLSQLLGLDDRNIVLAEVPFFDELLRARFKENGHDHSSFLPAAVDFYGQKRTGQEEKLFIKADSWHLFFYEQWRAFYPGIPFIMLYRRPDEVVRSQMKRKGLHAIPGLIEAAIFELGKLPSILDGNEHYMAAVLEQYYAKMHSILADDPLAYPFDYKEGMGNIVGQLMQLVGNEMNEQQKQAFETRLKFDAKDPIKIFSEAPIADQYIAPYLGKAFELYHALAKFSNQVNATTFKPGHHLRFDVPTT